jgi:FkbM family methyltransferase
VIEEAGIRMVETPGGRLFVSDADQGSVARALRNKGRYEKDWTAWMRANIGTGMHVVDVGANIGYYTVLLASLVGPTGRVIACEPDPGNAALLRRSVAENQFTHVQIVEAAVSDAEGRATLHQDSAWHGVHSLARDNCVNPGGGHVEVATVSLDSLRRDAADVDFVKIDAQGAEAAIVRGARRLLGQAHLRVLMEIWPFGIRGLGGSLDAVIAPFFEQGFRAWTMERSREVVAIDAATIAERAAALGTWSSFNLLWTK